MCAKCLPGQYSDEQGLSQCRDCQPGYYRGNEDDSCVACVPGYFAPNVQSPYCKDCVAGRYANASAANVCPKCSSDTFQDQPRSMQCQSCQDQDKYPEGYIPNEQKTACNKPPHTTVADCKNDEYLDDLSNDVLDHTCKRCPHGADCGKMSSPTSGTNVKKQMLSTLEALPNDWWPVPWAAPDTPTFVKCPHSFQNQKTFKGCHRDGINGCANHTGGPVCAVCDANYYRDTTGACNLCTAETVPLKIGFLCGFFILLFFLIWSQRKRIQQLRAKYGKAWRDIVRILTINLSYCQISSSLPSIINIPWPEKYLELLETLSFVEVDVVTLLGFKCVGGDFWDFRGRLLLACFVPPIVIVVCFIVYKCKSGHVQARAKHGTKSMKEMTMHSVEYLWDMFE